MEKVREIEQNKKANKRKKTPVQFKCLWHDKFENRNSRMQRAVVSNTPTLILGLHDKFNNLHLNLYKYEINSWNFALIRMQEENVLSYLRKEKGTRTYEDAIRLEYFI